MTNSLIIIKLSRGKICVANFRPPCNSCSSGQLFWPNRGICKSAQNGPILKFLSNFNTKSKFKGGVSNKWVCLSIGPKWTNFEFFQQFLVQNSNSKWVIFYGRTVLVKRMPADQPNVAWSNFLTIGNLKFKIIVSLFM